LMVGREFSEGNLPVMAFSTAAQKASGSLLSWLFETQSPKSSNGPKGGKRKRPLLFELGGVRTREAGDLLRRYRVSDWMATR